VPSDLARLLRIRQASETVPVVTVMLESVRVIGWMGSDIQLLAAEMAHLLRRLPGASPYRLDMSGASWARDLSDPADTSDILSTLEAGGREGMRCASWPNSVHGERRLGGGAYLAGGGPETWISLLLASTSASHHLNHVKAWFPRTSTP